MRESGTVARRVPRSVYCIDAGECGRSPAMTISAAAVVFVHDVPRMTAFYRDLANMQRVDGDDRHTVLERDGFQLTIHALAGAGTDFSTREDTYIKLCFPVADLAAARVLAGELGGELWPVAREWEARGFRACDGRDPEGNVFQLRMPAS
jgi:predicted enzyme related to lactoylglutathione lyase